MARTKGPPTNKQGALTAPHDVAGRPIRIYPPTAKTPYHMLAYELDGERRTTSGGRTLETALAKAARIAAQIDANATRSGKPFQELWDAWVDPGRSRKKQWSIKHAEGTAWVGKKRILPILGRVQCQDLRRKDVQKVLNGCPSESEAERARRALRACLRWGYAHGYLTVPVEQLIGDVHYQGARKPATSEQGADSLWVPPAAIPTHDAVADLAFQMRTGVFSRGYEYLAVWVAAYSGVRLGELLALRASDFDTGKRRIRVSRQWVESSAGRGQFTPPKGGKLRTTVYPATTPETVRYPSGFDLAGAVRARVKQVKVKDPDGLVFPSPQGRVWNPSNWYERRFHPAAEKAGWPTKKVTRMTGHGPQEVDGLVWTWHSLRHVFATYYLWELNAKAVDVSQAAGHSSVEITLRIYASDAPGALDRLNAL